MNVLLFGATGYIGTHIAKCLMGHGHAVTAIVRKAGSAPDLAALGAEITVGDLNDAAQLATFGRNHDAVMWCAQLMLEDELRVVNALLDNIAGTNKPFLFTSGTSLLSQRTDGGWNDNTYAEDDVFPPRKHIAPRLEIENMVRAAASRGIRAMCVRPPLVWGNGGSKVIADMFYSAWKTGAVCHVGAGLNVYSNIHVEDLSELYRIAMERGVAGALYHAVVGETNYRTIAQAIGRQLNLPTRSVTVGEAAEIWDKFMGPIVFSSCSRTRSPRSRDELGWAPSPDRQDILDDIGHPKYLEALGERALPPWVRQPT